MATAPAQMFGALALAVVLLALSVLSEASGSATVVVVPGDGGGASGYGEREFLADYKNPSVSVIQVKGDVLLTGDLPRLTRKVSIVGVGKKRPVINGQNKYAGIVTNFALTVKHVEFKFLVTSRVRGGPVVLSFGRDIEVEDCLFSNNTAFGSGAGGNGGAIYLYSNTKWKITKSEFFGNRAEQIGAALYAQSGSTGELNGVRFIDNFGRNRGGSLGLIGSSAMVEETFFRQPL